VRFPLRGGVVPQRPQHGGSASLSVAGSPSPQPSLAQLGREGVDRHPRRGDRVEVAVEQQPGSPRQALAEDEKAGPSSFDRKELRFEAEGAGGRFEKTTSSSSDRSTPVMLPLTELIRTVDWSSSTTLEGVLLIAGGIIGCLFGERIGERGHDRPRGRP